MRLLKRLKERFWPVRLSPYLNNHEAVRLQSQEVRMYQATTMVGERELSQCVNADQEKNYERALVSNLTELILKTVARQEVLRGASLRLDVQLEYRESFSTMSLNKFLNMYAVVRDSKTVKP